MFQGTRDESGVVDADLVQQDAQVRTLICIHLNLCAASIQHVFYMIAGLLSLH